LDSLSVYGSKGFYGALCADCSRPVRSQLHQREQPIGHLQLILGRFQGKVDRYNSQVSQLENLIEKTSGFLACSKAALRSWKKWAYDKVWVINKRKWESYRGIGSK
jgi:hypothetical protein